MVVLLMVAVIGFGLSTGISTLFISTNGTDFNVGPDAYAWDGTPPRIPITVPDPGGHERWAVQIYRSKAGNPCLRVGRVHRSSRGTADFGRVDPDGSFHRLDIEDSGSPTDLSKGPYALMINHYALTGMAAIFGIVTSNVKTVTLYGASAIKRLPIVGGAYLAVQQEADLRGAEVRFGYRNGTSENVKLRRLPRGNAPPTRLRAG